MAEKAVSSPPMVMSCETFRRSSEIAVLEVGGVERRLARNADASRRGSESTTVSIVRGVTC
jgi:hypothetical protein